MNEIEWLPIPAGTVLLEAGGYLAQPTTFNLPAYAISRYPVTNRQFAAFVAASGYENPQWWPVEGWRWRQKEKWTEPHHWQASNWNQPDCPVVGVSWYEALAFCGWLGELSGRELTLPSEQQWQRAAQGNDNREYPWGNSKPTPELCNWNRDQDKTSIVDQYPAGISPFGVMDMSGNVWEWCLTNWQNGLNSPEGPEPRLLRGGCWSSDSPISLRAAHRNPKDPNIRLAPNYRTHVTVGFRCALNHQLPNGG